MALQATNDDATNTKRCAVRLGYWQDDYIDCMKTPVGKTESYYPEIYLGYFTRVIGLRTLLYNFANHLISSLNDTKIQIINLGAGYDTLFWRIMHPSSMNQIKSHLSLFVDVDMSDVVAHKSLYIRRSPKLSEAVKEKPFVVKGPLPSSPYPNDIYGHVYNLVAADITNIVELEQKLDRCGMDYSVPTIFVCECVLVYLDPSGTQRLFDWIDRKFSITVPCAFINHEQLNMNDQFGAVMVDNFSSRGCTMPGLEACKSKQSQLDRFLLGRQWSGSKCWTMYEAYELLPADEVERIERICFLDEKELLKQLFDHYCLMISWRNTLSADFDEIDFWHR